MYTIYCLISMSFNTSIYLANIFLRLSLSICLRPDHTQCILTFHLCYFCFVFLCTYKLDGCFGCCVMSCCFHTMSIIYFFSDMLKAVLLLKACLEKEPLHSPCVTCVTVFEQNVNNVKYF